MQQLPTESSLIENGIAFPNWNKKQLNTIASELVKNDVYDPSDSADAADECVDDLKVRISQRHIASINALPNFMW